MYGKEMFPDLPAWDSGISAARVLAERGGFVAMLTAIGATPVPLAFLQRGDLVVAEDGRGIYVSLGHTIVGSHPDEGVWERPAHLILSEDDVTVLRPPHG